MPRRSRESQSKHDALVHQIAGRLEKEGYDVAADVRGFPQPKTLGGYRPDVIATKGRQRRIVEVETPESITTTRDRGQQQAFRLAARRSQNTTFQRKITD